MGTWTLESTKHNVSLLDDANNFGHNFRVTFTMKYTPKLGSAFTETPYLDWYENISKKDLTAQEWHTFEVNMYLKQPTSLTTAVWARRYWDAYHRASGGTCDTRMKGSSRLRAKDGKPVPINVLGAGITSPKDQVKAVREYLKANGGFLDIEIHDIPSIGLPLKANESTERILTFNVGIVGSNNNRVRAVQHLKVSVAEPKANWVQVFKVGPGHAIPWVTAGLTQVAPPPNSTTFPTPAAKQLSTEGKEYL
jgi:hypothetical protein